MDPGVPPWHGQRPQIAPYPHQFSTPISRAHYHDRPDQRDGVYVAKPLPHPEYHSERYYQKPDIRPKHQNQLDPTARYHAFSPPPRRPEYWGGPDSRPGYHTDEPFYRPHSRQGYEYLSRDYLARDSRPSYGSYYPRHHRGVHEYRDWEKWSEYDVHYDFRSQNCYDDSRYGHDKVKHSGKDPYVHRHEELEDRSHCDWTLNADLEGHSRLSAEDKDSRYNQPPVYESTRLADYKESGLSSSSYELSQYIDSSDFWDLPSQTAWSPVRADEPEQVAPKPVTPLQFTLPHVRVSFSAGGQLIRVCPNLPPEGEPALIEIHSLEVILCNTPEQEEMRTFPGPLVREDLHKVDVIMFSQHKEDACRKSKTLKDRDSAALVWQLLVLLCRQNGSVAGSDIAELLVPDCRTLGDYKKPLNEQQKGPSLINLTGEEEIPVSDGMPDLLTGEIMDNANTPKQALEKFTRLLLFGRKKEALEWAMRSRLWGHALFLASKMDNRTYSYVMSRFTTGLAMNDPLQTLFQLLSGRIPQASTCCGDERWRGWRPHLATILANQTGDPELSRRAIITMGDTLALKGLIDAAHVCYLMAEVPFGSFGVKTDKLVLLGSDHGLPFQKFATNEAIQRTEMFEYCQRLGNPHYSIPAFQAFKFIYACRLVDYGLPSQALHYCEGIVASVLKQPMVPSPVLLAGLIRLAERLKLCDPQLSERPEEEQELEPDWLKNLRNRYAQVLGTSCSSSRKCIYPYTLTANQQEEGGRDAGLQVDPGVLLTDGYPMPFHVYTPPTEGSQTNLGYQSQLHPVTGETQSWQPEYLQGLPHQLPSDPQVATNLPDSWPTINSWRDSSVSGYTDPRGGESGKLLVRCKSFTGGCKPGPDVDRILVKTI
nr:PREDICTED: protein transport protein Sec16B [Latimeria chalumnae]|eukprot:XP_014342756.1 PREDICTED: protein transport protein Sec16B [Latimeria chalumnae]